MDVNESFNIFIEEILSKEYYIFGAGVIGKLTARFFIKKYRKRPKAFCITKLSYEKELLSIPIVEYKGLPKDSLIIVAVLPNTQDEIAEVLKKDGYTNIIFVSEYDIVNMRREVVALKDELASQKIRLGNLFQGEMSKNYKKLIVSDYVLDEVTKWIVNAEVIQSESFINSEFKNKEYDSIIFFLFDQSKSVKKLLYKASRIVNTIHISLRSRYMQKDCIVEYIKDIGWQLSGYTHFFRPEYEYDTEDILMVIEKRHPEILFRDHLCTGCGMCKEQCPTNSISLEENCDGNYKPKVDITTCINCGKCIDDCPVYDKKTKKDESTCCYAFMANDEVRRKSSSGGAFSVLAEGIFEKKGYVCGAAWEKDFSIKHIIIKDNKELSKLRGSKYAYSDIGGLYSGLKELSKSGKPILVVGLPCQIAALRTVMSKIQNNIVFVDLICTQAPPIKLFKRYLSENYEVDKLIKIGFREKSNGWNYASFYVEYENGTKEIKGISDIYQQAYHSRLMMPIHCENCNFCKKRVGDITIGDFWGIQDIDPEMDDGEGTSIVIINTDKGMEWLPFLELKAKKIKKENLNDERKYNRLGTSVATNNNRDRFYKIFRETGDFNKAVDYSVNFKYDVCLVGNWSFPNYGTELTYYSLFNAIKLLKKTVGLIEWPEDSEWKPYGCSQLFCVERYSNEDILPKSTDIYEMRKNNAYADCFIHGSDQLLSPFHLEKLQKSALMTWVDMNKVKIGYALSFGKKEVEYDYQLKKVVGAYLRKYDAISVREASAKDNLDYMFGIDAALVLDPVFLNDKEVYKDLIKDSEEDEIKEEYVFAYILDFNDEIIYRINELADHLNIKVIFVTDAENTSSISNRKVDVLFGISINRWIALLDGCRYVVTDSFHGTCMSIIFNKKFVSIKNKWRGETRFDNLINVFDIGENIVSSIAEMNVKTFEALNYEKINNILEKEKKESVKWLEDSIEKKHEECLTDNELILQDQIIQLEKKINKMMRKLDRECDD